MIINISVQKNRNLHKHLYNFLEQGKKTNYIFTNLQGPERAHSLLFDANPWRSLDINPCVSSNPSQDIRKPDIIVSHCARHPVTCHPKFIKSFEAYTLKAMNPSHRALHRITSHQHIYQISSAYNKEVLFFFNKVILKLNYHHRFSNSFQLVLKQTPSITVYTYHIRYLMLHQDLLITDISMLKNC